MALGIKIKTLRREKGFSLRGLESIAHVDHSYIGKIENEQLKSPPTPQVLGRLGKALGADVQELLLLANQKEHIDQFEEATRLLLGNPDLVSPSNGEALMQAFGVKSGDKLKGFTRFIRGLPMATQNVITKEAQKFSTEANRAMHRWSLLGLLYFLIHRSVKYEIENSLVIEKLLSEGKRVVLIVNHRDVAQLLMLLLKRRLDIKGLNNILTIVSDSADGEEAKRFLDKSKTKIHYVSRPRVDTSESRIKRALALRRVLKLALAIKGSVVATVVDERSSKTARQRRLSNGAILLAAKLNAFIVPVAVRNSVEVVLGRSWDRLRIPLRGGKIRVGTPSKLKVGVGGRWRKAEIMRLANELETLDAELGSSIGSIETKIGG